MINQQHLVEIENSSIDQITNRCIDISVTNVENDLLSSTPLTTEVTTRSNAISKLLYLDGLRGILCLIVVFSHALLMGKTKHEEKFSIFFRPWMQHSPLRLLVAGEFAVASFFVLSGCVLVRRYFELFNDISILFSGTIRRFPRLFIPSSVALLLYFSILHFRPFYGFNECHEIGEGSVNAENIGLGYVLLNTFGQYFWMPAFDLDACGLLNFCHSIKQHWSISLKLSLLLLTIYFGSYPVFNTDVLNGNGTLWSPFRWMFGWFWISFGGFCLLLLSIISKNIQHFLSTKLIHFLGKISFGIYLTHYIILCIVDVSFVHWTAPHLGRDLAVILGLFLFALPIIFSISYLFYLFVDVPAVQISDWLYFIICNRCLKLKKRPKPIKRYIWIILVSLISISIIISAIPALQGNQRCNNQSSKNLTLTST
ncbi:unnamed protein product [Rotaria socialis]